MALVLKDRVKQAAAAPGTGTITLGSTPAGFQSFAVVGNSNTTYFAIVDSASGDWEVNYGTYTSSGTTLSRNATPLSSSAGGALVNFTGAVDVFVTYPSSRSAYQNEAGTQVVQQSFGAITATSAALTTGTISTLPTTNTDIVNKQYADAIASGIHFHEAVELATTAALPANTYNNGTSGVGATLTATANGALSVDSTLTVVANRVLVKNEVTQANNGVYVVTQVGSAGTPYILTRATDFNTAGAGVNQIDEGDFFLVTSGVVNLNTAWVQQTAPPIVVGTTALVFQQFAAPITYTAGTGLNESPTYTFNIANTTVTAATYGSASQVPVFAVNAQGQLTSVTNTAIAINGSAVTGAISGQAGSVANALTLGTYLTGTSYNGGTAVTATVDATSANTVSKVVARDSSGNFSAGTITATLSGAATSATTATNLAGGAANQIPYQTAAGTTSFITAASGTNYVLNFNGSIFTWVAGTISGVALGSNLNSLTAGTYLTGTAYNGSAAQTFAVDATSANTASKVVARDASGNFSAGTITAALSGNATTATTATNVSGTVGTANGGTGLTSFTSGGVVYASSTSALATGSSLVFDGTNLGLGVTPSAWGGALSAGMDFKYSGGIASHNSANAFYLVANGYYNSSGVWKYRQNGYANYVNVGNGDGSIAFYTAPSGTAGNSVTFTQAMTLDASGNLGVGTTSPNLRADIQASASPNGDAIRVLGVGTLNTATAGYGGGVAFGGYYNGTSSYVADFAGIQGFKENSTANDYAGALRFTTRINAASPTERMRISSAGDVGIGTSSPTFISGGGLEVYNSSVSRLKLTNSTTGTASTDGLDIHINSTDANIVVRENFPLIVYTNNAERMRITSAGIVGIGTSSPDTTTLLTVAGAVTITGGNTGHGASRLKLGQDTSTVSQLRFYGPDASTAGVLQFTGSSSDGTVGGERARIDSVGNVLIGGTAARGTTAGTAHLDLFNGTAPAGTLTNGISLYSDSGDLKFMNAAGTAFDVGYRNIPQNAQSGSYTMVLADAGKHIYHASGDGAATYTIPAASSVAYPLGTAITFVNLSATSVSIAITTDTMYLSSAGTTGTRTLAQYGTATAIKVSGVSSSGIWVISGSGLT